MSTSRGKSSRFASALSTKADSAAAFQQVVDESLAQLGTRPQLALLFASMQHADYLESFGPKLRGMLGTDVVLGCTGESIVGGGREVEHDAAVALWLADFGSAVSLTSMHLKFNRTPDGGVIDGWPDDYADAWPADTSLLLLGDPYSFPADLLLEQLNEDRPGVRVVGGMASSSNPGTNRLLCQDRIEREGAVVAMLTGPVRMRTLVSQGCRPIGRHFVVTRAERNVIQELGGKPALLQLKEIFDTLPTREQQLVQSALHVGRVVSEYQDRFEQGDFLIRNVIGWDPNDGAIAIGDFIRPGQTVQFHIRDHGTADDDFRQRLASFRQESPEAVGGALLFTCNGRGTHLFPEPNHDSRCVEESLGRIPLAGFFAAGELGPVGNRNFMHGFTASMALFE